MNDKDNRFTKLNEDLEELREKYQRLVQEKMTADIFASADVAVITTLLQLTYKDMLLLRQRCLISCVKIDHGRNFEKSLF